jgi:methionyl-tRNA synthetase
MGYNFDPAADYDKLTAWGGLQSGDPIEPGKSLYPRLSPPVIEKEDEMPEITIDEFKQLDLRVAEILEAEEVAGADKLYRLRVNDGDRERTLVAGIKEHYTPEQLKGRQVVIIANLKPATIRGIESRGMILAASDGKAISILTPETEVKVGSKIS